MSLRLGLGLDGGMIKESTYYLFKISATDVASSIGFTGTTCKKAIIGATITIPSAYASGYAFGGTYYGRGPLTLKIESGKIRIAIISHNDTGSTYYDSNYLSTSQIAPNTPTTVIAVIDTTAPLDANRVILYKDGTLFPITLVSNSNKVELNYSIRNTTSPIGQGRLCVNSTSQYTSQGGPFSYGDFSGTVSRAIIINGGTTIYPITGINNFLAGASNYFNLPRESGRAFLLDESSNIMRACNAQSNVVISRWSDCIVPYGRVGEFASNNDVITSGTTGK